ncbi:MAG: anaerobic ribonucleoside-triphosphate reductase, partial [Candidatus Thorarchaeota archaeon]
MDLLPKVFRTEGNITEFDPTKIFDSIIKETGMSESDAKHITELVVRRIISSGIKFLSGPHIREIVCSILSEQHFESERKLYTRIGMPLMDYEEILEKKYLDKPYLQINPEKLHHRAANQIAEEYAHLRVLSNEESKAHLAGDIHINGLNYFVLRPFSQIWDPRFLLRYGIPPIKNLVGYYKEKPADNLELAISHLSKWLGIIQSEFYGNQGFNNLTTFLAPYTKNQNNNEIIRIIRKFIYDLNNLSLIIGREISKTSLILSPTIIENFSDLKIINFNGSSKNIYKAYQEECIELFKAIMINLEEAYKNPQLLSIPYNSILIDDNGLYLVDENFPKFWENTTLIQKLTFMNLYHDNYKSNYLEKLVEEDCHNFGVLQNITLNLPKLAIISKNESNFFELLNSKLILCSSILLKKYDIIKKRINSKHLPFCSGIFNNNNLYKLENQFLSVSLVGLNESMKCLTNYELHEHSEAVTLSNKVLSTINKVLAELSEKQNRKFILTENTSKIAIERFQRLDIKDFPKELDLISPNQQYTNSIQYRDNIEINIDERIKVQGDFHRWIQEGAIISFSLNDLKKNDYTVKNFLLKVIKDSKISRFISNSVPKDEVQYPICP